MKQFFCVVLDAAKKHLSKTARACAVVGASLFTAFALVGMVKTAQYWFPVLVLGLLAVGGAYLYKLRKNRIPPERKAQVIGTVCTAISHALHAEMPYRFDAITPEETALHAQITRDSGADIVRVQLLLLEKHADGIDMGLLRQVFVQRLAHYGRTPGLTNCAYCAQIPLLALAGMELAEPELTLHVIYTDSRAATLYYKHLQEREREARKEALRHNPPRLQKQENNKQLTEDDFL